MRSVARGLLLVAALATGAHADHATLDEAKRALEEVRYDDAQRLLVAALDEGDNSLATTRELYKLSANTAIVLGQREVGEQFYRGWLALDPQAQLSSDVSPKLREAFDAAAAYITAHGRLELTAQRTTGGVVVAVLSDPLTMARTTRVDPPVPGQAPAVFDPQRRATLVTATAAQRVLVFDQHGNTIAELDVAADAGAVGPTGVTGGYPVPTPAPRSHLYLAFGIPSAGLILFGLIGGALAVQGFNQTKDTLDASYERYYVDVEARRSRAQTLGYVSGGALVLGVALAIPTGILFYRSQTGEPQVTPYANERGAGVQVTGRF